MRSFSGTRSSSLEAMRTDQRCVPGDDGGEVRTSSWCSSFGFNSIDCSSSMAPVSSSTRDTATGPLRPRLSSRTDTGTESRENARRGDSILATEVSPIGIREPSGTTCTSPAEAASLRMSSRSGGASVRPSLSRTTPRKRPACCSS